MKLKHQSMERTDKPQVAHSRGQPPQGGAACRVPERSGKGWFQPLLPALLALLLIPLLPVAFGSGPLALSGPMVLHGQDRVEEVRSLAPDGRLSVAAVRHAVTVQVWDRDEVEVVATLDEDREELEISGDERDLSIEIQHARGGMRGPSGSATLELRVPAGIRLELSTVSGSQQVAGLTGSVRMSSTSGSQLLEGAPSSADLNVVSGSVQVTGVIPELRVNAVSGRVEIEGVEGRVDVSAVSGSVRIEASQPLEQLRVKAVSGSIQVSGPFTSRASVELETHSGSVTLQVPSATPAAYELDTMSGSIRNGISGDEPRSPRFGPGRSLDFRVGDATARVRIQTFSGGIRLEALN
jgi:hypothetical protein